MRRSQIIRLVLFCERKQHQRNCFRGNRSVLLWSVYAHKADNVIEYCGAWPPRALSLGLTVQGIDVFHNVQEFGVRRSLLELALPRL